MAFAPGVRHELTIEDAKKGGSRRAEKDRQGQAALKDVLNGKVVPVASLRGKAKGASESPQLPLVESEFEVFPPKQGRKEGPAREALLKHQDELRRG